MRHEWGSSPIPIPEDVLTYYVLARCDDVRPGTLNSIVYAVRAFHLDFGLKYDVTKFHSLRRILKGIRRDKGDAPRDRRLPLTPAILQRFFGLLGSPSHNITVRSLRAAFATATLGMLRCCEYSTDR